MFPQIDVKRLRIALCGSDKLPLDASGTKSLELFTNRGESLGFHAIELVKSDNTTGKRKTAKHRIYTTCPHCGERQPIGRLQQHKRYKHNPNIRHYRYLTAEIGSYGLTLKLTKEGRELLRDNDDKDDTTRFNELVEPMIANSDFETLTADDIGALTSCPIILSDEVQRNDRGDITQVGRVFWHERYAVELACDKLQTRGGLYLQLVDNQPGYNMAYNDGIRAYNSKEANEVPNQYKAIKLAIAWRRGWLTAAKFAQTAVVKLLHNS